MNKKTKTNGKKPHAQTRCLRLMTSAKQSVAIYLKLGVLTILVMLSASLDGIGQTKTILIQNQRELFVDSYLIGKLHNADIRLGNPKSGGIAFKFDKSWEGIFAGAYVSVIKDKDEYRIYYRGVGEGKGANGEVNCLATSKDGINWIKPNLGLFKVKGTLANNVVMPGNLQQSSHNFSVYLDDRAGVPAKERYKAVGGVSTSARKARGLYRYVSEDGMNWKRFSDTTALFTDGYAMDSQNVLTWVPSENCYAIYLRTWTNDKPGDAKLLKGVRTISRSTSTDFVHWTTPEVMKFGDAPLEDLYTNATHPYFRAPQLMISMPFRFSPESRVLTDEEMIKNGIEKTMWKGVADAVLLTSRGGNVYERKFLESFVRPGLDQRNWAARSNIPALGVIPTGPTEMSLFLTRAYSTKDCFLERMTLRTDGFASLHAGYTEGSLITKPITLKGKIFSLNYSTSSVGYVKVILLNAKGQELPGFTEADSPKIVGDKIDGTVTWKSGKTLADLGDKPVQIKFVVRDADIYAFGIFDK